MGQWEPLTDTSSQLCFQWPHVGSLKSTMVGVSHRGNRSMPQISAFSLLRTNCYVYHHCTACEPNRPNFKLNLCAWATLTVSLPRLYPPLRSRRWHKNWMQFFLLKRSLSRCYAWPPGPIQAQHGVSWCWRCRMFSGKWEKGFWVGKKPQEAGRSFLGGCINGKGVQGRGYGGFVYSLFYR